MRRFATLVLILVAGCSAAPSETVAPSASPAPTRSPTRTVRATTLASATPRACLSVPGRIIVEEIQIEGMARSLPYRVYLPPCYSLVDEPAYPVLILIHGLQSTDSQWDDLGVNETADAMIRAGSCRRW